MILHIKFEDNLVNTNLAQQTKIPCHIQVSNVFNIRFDASIPVANGTVAEWDKVKFASRALARAGG